MGSWDYPLSRQEKMRRVVLLFEGEVDRGEREIATLRHENDKLRTVVQSLVSIAPKDCEQKSAKPRCSASGNAAPEETSCQSVDTSLSEAQRMASLIDQTSRSVVEETYCLIDQTSKKVVEDTEEVKEVLLSLHEKSANVVDAALSDIDSYMDSFIDQTSRKVAEDTEEVRGAIKTLHENVDIALTESAEALKRSHVLQTLEEVRADSAGLAKIAQAQLEEFGGRTQEQIQALSASLWQWGQSESSAKNSEDVSGGAFDLGEKTQERIQSLGASLGWWSAGSQKTRSRSTLKNVEGKVRASSESCDLDLSVPQVPAGYMPMQIQKSEVKVGASDQCGTFEKSLLD